MSDSTKPQASGAILRSYYCLCGDFVLVLQGKLDRLPQRKTDGAYIIRTQPSPSIPARKFKLAAVPSERILLERVGGTEIRQGFVCSRCRTPIAYQTTPPPAGKAPFLYILKGAVTETQGQVPPDAFEGERAAVVVSKLA
ncbi:hypothetical protein CspHIS471_0312480 [Cutaneotrichosporon sp. HIS471]|nr:hypothetical protein CspHIS471_0312480 [Cutaneotrichosporon sp. HIS471]